MAVEIGNAVIPVRPDLDGFQSGIEREAKGALGSLKTFAKNAGAAIAGAFVVQKGLQVVKDSLDAARESIAVSKQTEAVIKSTGGAANVTSKQIGDYASRLQKLSGVSDENIQSGANMLLTFTKVRNEVGKGNNIFDRATATLLDMSVATGQDMSSAAVQLGKALNDPIAGVSALARVGVQFTDQQKAQIKTMTEAGDVMGAQKVILAELNTQFGGSAKAAGDALDPMQRLSIWWGDMQEQLGLWLIPKIESFVEWMGKAADFTKRNEDVVKPLAAAIGVLTAAVIAVNLATKAYSATTAAATTVKGFFISTTNAETGATTLSTLARGRDTVATVASTVAKGAAAAATGTLTAAQWALNAAMSANPFVLVAALLAALVAGIVIAYQKSETFRNIVNGAFRAVADAAVFMKDMAVGAFRLLVDTWLAQAEWIVKGAAKAFGWVPGIGGKLKSAAKEIEQFRDDVNAALGGIKDKVVSVTFKGGGGGDFGGQGVSRSWGDPKGGSTLARVRSALTAGTYVTSTYRDPASNRRAGGSPTSYHLDRNNPAVDIGGSTPALDAVYRRLRQMGSWRELLWREPGHFDHVHVAHTGGYVTPQGIQPLRSDELLTKLQVGETVLPKGSGGDRRLLEEQNRLLAIIAGNTKPGDPAIARALATAQMGTS